MDTKGYANVNIKLGDKLVSFTFNVVSDKVSIKENWKFLLKLKFIASIILPIQYSTPNSRLISISANIYTLNRVFSMSED